nr:MAG TPA: hypothetical protein [Caudoviricetes sp.]
MAKNISKNQWFKDIIDNVYLNTAVLNNILIATIKPTAELSKGTVLATARNKDLFQNDAMNDANIYTGNLINLENGKLKATDTLYTQYVCFIAIALKNKQLETDFYSPEQLAEMYPNDPAYQVATADLLDDDIPDKVKSEPTIEPPVSGTEPTVASEVSNNDEPS